MLHIDIYSKYAKQGELWLTYQLAVGMDRYIVDTKINLGKAIFNKPSSLKQDLHTWITAQ